MATIVTFEEMQSWQKARELAREVYRITRTGNFAKNFALKGRIRRAVVSMSSNIAEGFERGGNREFRQFLSHAKGSCGEVRSQLYVALDENYITQEQHENLNELCLAISRLIEGFAAYLRRSNLKGRKFTSPADTQDQSP